MTDLRKAAEMALNALAFKEIMKWADIYAAHTGEIYAQAALDPSKTATMAKERKTLAVVVARHTSPFSEPVKERIGEHYEPLYDAPPPKREWVGLTSEELATIVVEHAGFPTRQAEAIEAKLKEKNT